MFTVSSSPHIRASHTTQSIMRDVIIALVPALLAGIYFFGFRALLLTLVSVVCCVGFEWLWEKCLKKPITIGDLSAVVTGILLAYNLPVNVPIFIVVVGAFVAIILVKQIFGGIGQNFMNPALTARAFLLASYSTSMRQFSLPRPAQVALMADATHANLIKAELDVITSATPLELIKNGLTDELTPLLDVFIGNVGGCIGEVSALALLIGGIYLIVKKVIRFHIPACYIGTVFILTLVLSKFDFYHTFYSLFAGGLILGAFFMATDYATTPITYKGQIIFAVGAGILTTLIRMYGGYPEGVSYSILIMNLTVPLIDQYIKKRPFGEGVQA